MTGIIWKLDFLSFTSQRSRLNPILHCRVISIFVRQLQNIFVNFYPKVGTFSIENVFPEKLLKKSSHENIFSSAMNRWIETKPLRRERWKIRLSDDVRHLKIWAVVLEIFNFENRGYFIWDRGSISFGIRRNKRHTRINSFEKRERW